MIQTIVQVCTCESFDNTAFFGSFYPGYAINSHFGTITIEIRANNLRPRNSRNIKTTAKEDWFDTAGSETALLYLSEIGSLFDGKYA